MFTKDKRNSNGKKADYPVGSVTTIAHGTKINGDIESDNDMRIDGTVTGNIICKAKVVLGESGHIEGDLNAAAADVFGTVNGHVATKDLLCLKTKCVINGDLHVGKLDIEQNAIFNGKCNMVQEQSAQTVSKQPLTLNDYVNQD